RVPIAGERRTSRAIKMPAASWRPKAIKVQTREVVGIEVLLEEPKMTAAEVGAAVEALTTDTPLELALISSRGNKVYPGLIEDTEMIETWRCRFVRREHGQEVTDDQMFTLLGRLGKQFRWSNVQKLQVFDGVPGFTKVSGEA
ncbi:MAG: isocitrate dehydrogenase, partial [Gaiellales bacterium]